MNGATAAASQSGTSSEELEDVSKQQPSVDVRRLTSTQRRQLVDRVLENEDQDAESFFSKEQARMDRLDMLPKTIEVRFERLSVKADVYVSRHGSDRSLPTLFNEVINMASDALVSLRLRRSGKQTQTLLDDVSGIIPPGRLTLLLGPPGSGKSTLLKALCGKLRHVQASGSITYNGEELNGHGFETARTAAYVEQTDKHMGELTVRETLDFAARCQGAGRKADELQQMQRREQELGVVPDRDLNTFQEAEVLVGKRQSIVTDFVQRLLGLDICSDTLVGNEMLRGISGGQKKRVTSGEMVVGPYKTFFMDEVTTGLDSSTTFQIVKVLRDFVHLRQATVLAALLQPPPEVYDLFDDVMLLAEGVIVFHGPRSEVVPFFLGLGFQIPARVAVADFLQEVTSRKDQKQFWAAEGQPWRYIPVTQIADAFRATSTGQANAAALAKPFRPTAKDREALVREEFALGPLQVFKALLHRDWILIKRNSVLYVSRFTETIIVAFVIATLFPKPRMDYDSVEGGALLLGALFYGVVQLMFDGFTEMYLVIERLPVYYKQLDNRFFAPWAFVFPTTVLRLPYSVLQAVLWSIIVYFSCGLAPEAGRFFIYVALLAVLHQMGVNMARAVGAAARSESRSNTWGFGFFLLIMILGGFVLAKPDIPVWWRWAYYVSPLTYAQNVVNINEYSAARWQVPDPGGSGRTLGDQILFVRGVPTDRHWVWLGFVALIAWTLVFSAMTWFFHAAVGPLDPPQSMVSEENLQERDLTKQGRHTKPSGAVVIVEDEKTEVAVDAANPVLLASARSLQASSSPHGSRQSIGSRKSIDIASTKAIDKPPLNLGRRSVTSELLPDANTADGSPSDAAEEVEEVGAAQLAQRGMVLPFEPLAVTFGDVHYWVDLPKDTDTSDPDKLGPKVSTPPGRSRPMLELLCGVSGAFRPGVLTALVGVSGAGKTTLMDVLAGRKTGGMTTGDIRVDGHPKVHATFARVSGYVEQFDVHNAKATVVEALLFSCRLRMGPEVDNATVRAFVDEVMQLVELRPLRHAMVGSPGVSGLSVEQRKRLTIAAELVANPSVVFMDEPTSGLDARAAAIVMRAVRNTVDTGRTVVCTIHQPALHIFESFDELLLLKRGGEVIYMGPLGTQSQQMVDYFQVLPGVAPIRPGMNPATWVLEVTTPGAEAQLGVDFAQLFRDSSHAKRNAALIEELSVPAAGSEPLAFEREFPQSATAQLGLLLRRNFKTYWRSPEYNGVRMFSTGLIAVLLGSVFWDLGDKTETAQDVQNVLGGLFVAMLFVGFINCMAVQPVVCADRPVMYRERAAGMYSVMPHSLAQILVELPWNVAQVSLYAIITFFMIGFETTFVKFAWYWLIVLLTLIIFTNFGLMAVALTPNLPLAGVFTNTIFGIWIELAGFILPASKIPGWWIWAHYLSPITWSLHGIIVTQLGDFSNRMIELTDGSLQSVPDYLDSIYNYSYGMRGVVVGIQLAFIVAFTVITAVAQKVLNFQNR